MLTLSVEPTPLPPGMPFAHKTVLVLDLIESVVQMESDEVGTILRWHQFAQEATALTHKAGGRVIKSLGDGLLAVFDDVPSASRLAALLHVRVGGFMREDMAGIPMQLRMAITQGRVYFSHTDIYGTCVNLAFRLVKIAQAGDTILDKVARQDLDAGAAAHAQYLGLRRLKHLAAPVRAFRLHTPIHPGAHRPGEAVEPLRRLAS